MAIQSTIVIHGFKQTFEKNPATGVYDKAVDWVTYSPIWAVKTTTVTERIDKLRPPERLAHDDEGRRMEYLRLRWAMIEPQYEAWKKGIDMPLEGTPLSAWPAVNEAFVRVFSEHGIKTIEGVATMTDAVITKIPLPNMRELRRQAQLFLENMEKTAATNRLAANERQIAELQEQLDAAMALLKEQAEEAQAGEKRRGRRRKAHEEVEDTDDEFVDA